MGDLFGTDGVRGIPGQYPLVPDVVRRLGYAAASVLSGRRQARLRNGTQPLVLIGRDTRGSGFALGKYLAEGFARAHWAAADIGVLPTPAMAYLVPRRGALCGAVISASHNPAEFNGIKLFTADGFKMSAQTEREIERRLQEVPYLASLRLEISKDPRAEREYIDFLRSTFPPTLDLSGMRLAIDCANGSACRIGPRLFESLGAEVIALGCRPSGSNINLDCGALATEAMRRQAARRRCHAGVSFDGDADRAIFADSSGQLLDGDALIAMAAVDLQERGLLKNNGVVLTVMSNFGLIRFLEERGIRVVSVPVGDRNVTEAIERESFSLGGESSGHIVFRRFAPTGDGLLTALQVLAILARSKRGLGVFRRTFKMYPQVLKNVPARAKVPLENLPHLRREIRDCERRLRGRGRVLVRYSGTEPLIRIMLEGPERPALVRMSNRLADIFAKEIQDHVH